ncbi:MULTISPECIES: hypothetical protein [unclassified Streptomyces]|uniref:hypothetical protein n=1 Tax=unclassified Streptomyces TaxID=2593676 RepID=UPI001F045ED8|nr:MULTISPECIES: hypothetical protein [unclassified Streptomyces]MCH0564834.1 hypothetical protein [Streptomyces sp. MUM 2J]MCH0569892.1 hypothetical protein [Streptomyces sp. MUM 136J]
MPRFPSFRRSVAASAGIAVAALSLSAALPVTAHAAQAGRYYHTWATNVNVRVSDADPNTCGRHPSVANCPDVRERLQPGTQFYVYCQGPGQTVGGNPYWLMINSGTATGWMASYYVAYPDNRLPGVPDCPGMSGVSGAGAPVAARSGRALGPYSVTAYETVNIRSAPNTSSRAFDKIRAGETRSDALCWTHGETIRDHGYTNDVWIGFTEGWASAVYLKGNEYAGLPADAKC